MKDNVQLYMYIQSVYIYDRSVRVNVISKTIDDDYNVAHGPDS